MTKILVTRITIANGKNRAYKCKSDLPKLPWLTTIGEMEERRKKILEEVRANYSDEDEKKKIMVMFNISNNGVAFDPEN